MILTEQQTNVIKDLQEQEKLCIEKYQKGMEQAKDPQLKNLFETIKKEEQEHYDSLSQVLQGSCPKVAPASTMHNQYTPTATYFGTFNKEDQASDKFLCTDAIATEKYVSATYNNDLFSFEHPEIRQLLNHIQTEEQKHAEMIYKYKTVNQMV